MTGNNFNVWQESFIESFLEINSQSNIKSDWLNYSEILKTEYKLFLYFYLCFCEPNYPKKRLVRGFYILRFD